MPGPLIPEAHTRNESSYQNRLCTEHAGCAFETCPQVANTFTQQLLSAFQIITRDRSGDRTVVVGIGVGIACGSDLWLLD